MASDTTVRPNTDEVAAKVLDGEAIIINLSTGMYYSLDAAGGLAWDTLGAGATVGEIVDAIIATYEVERDRAEADVRRLVTELQRAGLVRLGPDAPGARPAPARTPATARGAYAPPQLQAYDDMAELLALDPPHPLLTSTLSGYRRDADPE